LGGSLLEAFTASLPGASMLASPQITAILFFFIRNVTPLFSRPATLRERSTTALASKVTPCADSP
jgi:hypothetical protein